MLQIRRGHTLPDGEGMEQGSSPAEMLQSIAAVVRRQFWLILIIVAATMVLGLVYLLTTPARFTATATMVIDTRKVQLFQQQSVLGDITVDAGTVETQVEILKSENISLAAIKELRLTDDSEFVGPGGGLFGAAMAFISGLFESSDEIKSEFDLKREALEKFEYERTIKRVGLTYVMEIGFRSLSPEKAANIANAIVDAYIVDQLEAKYQATRRASVWLQDRIKELRTQASAAEKAVIDYKEKNNIVETGGRLMSEQQLAEVNSQLILARAISAEAKARLERINDIMKQPIPNESVTDALKNETIVKLRGQYVDLANREANWSGKYGYNHLAAINLRNQMLEIRRNIGQELQRIQAAYQSDYDIARAREDSIKNSLANVVSEAQLTNQAQIQLRELESNAQTYRAMYDNFLQRYMEAVQHQSFPITEARLISPASRPLNKSHPKSLVVLAIAAAGGLVLSFGAAYLREANDNVFRTSKQVEEALQTNCIAIVPVVPTPGEKKKTSEVAQLFDAAGDETAASAERLLSYVVEKPLSRFAEAMRSLKIAVDVSGMVKVNKVIAVTSAIPAEGKSTIAVNLAQLIAHAGGRVILVDADMRNRSLTRSLAPDFQYGLVDVVAEKTPLTAALVSDPRTGMTFLPAIAKSKLLHTNEILASAAMKTLIENLRSAYDYVILDLPPLSPVVDARATIGLVDSYVYVIEWGRTRTDVIEHSLAQAHGIYDRLLGVVLNKADTKMLGRYEHYYGSSYYKRHYARYGYVE